MTKAMSRNEAVIKARMYKDNSSSIHISDAKLCIDCDNIHNSNSCPVCTSNSFLKLRKVLNKD